jgi:Fe-S-cluster containining protein
LADIRDIGPLAGSPRPVYGGRPADTGCEGCTDCCHLPEISVTEEEADTLRRRHRDFGEELQPLLLHDDPAHEGWRIMQGPCVFRRIDTPLAQGGCRIYDDRPAGCAIFTCSFLLAQWRSRRAAGEPERGS